MCAAHCDNVRPIHLEIKQGISWDSTKNVADFQEIVLVFGIFLFIGLYYWKQYFRARAWGSICSNPYSFELTGFRPESNRGPADNPNLYRALLHWELWWQIHHRRSFRTLFIMCNLGCSKKITKNTLANRSWDKRTQSINTQPEQVDGRDPINRVGPNKLSWTVSDPVLGRPASG